MMKTNLQKTNNKEFIIPLIDFEKGEEEKRRKNLSELYQNMDSPGFKTKVKNYAEKFQYSYPYLIKRIKEDSSFAMQFAIDPSKQSFHQAYAAEFISKLPFINDFQICSVNGKKALYIIEGKIIDGANISDKKTSKSIDFNWKYVFNDKVLNFYATHKHTKEEGGAQDNQFNDVQVFHENASNCKDENAFFFSITDGIYYTETKNKLISSISNQPISRVQYMNEKCCGLRSKATTTNELLYDMLIIIKKWLLTNFTYDEIKEELIQIEWMMSAYEKKKLVK